MNESAKMIIVLTTISGIAGLGLAAMDQATRKDIAANARLLTIGAINQIIPETDKPDPCTKAAPGFDNAPDQDAICVGDVKVYRARKGDEIVGIAAETQGDKAYSGKLTVLSGIRMSDGTLTGIKVLKHAETPGLGSPVAGCAFHQQLVGNTPDSIRWTVKKDGGDVIQLTGATISSRSLLNALSKAQAVWRDRKDEIIKATPIAVDGGCNGQ